jgi:predicted AlkP superfamily pyrophosphatase or phosphodiesterase
MKKKVRLSIFIDALGYKIAQENKFLRDLSYRKEVEMQFGYSSSALPTIITGESPRVHKKFSFFYYDPKNSPFKSLLYRSFALLPGILVNHWRVRNVISKFVAKVKKYTGYFNLYLIPFNDLHKVNYSEKKDIFVPQLYNGRPNLQRTLQELGVKYFHADWKKNEVQNFDDLKTDIKKGEIEFAWMYCAELDGLLHQYGTDHEEIRKKLKWYEQKVHEVLNLASHGYDDVELQIFSDHGMTNHTENVNIRKKLHEAGVDQNGYFAVLDSTMARFWYKNEETKAHIHRVLKELDGDFLTRAEKVRYGVDFEGDMYGEDIFLVKPGVQIIPSDMGNNPCKGMHGYDPNHEDSSAVFLSTHKPCEEPLHIKDFFNLMVEGF